MDNNKITIVEVARKAGVSKGTVDRVVHNRGEVSKKSEEKVRKAIEELGYEPNLYASLLATRKEHVIACLMPKYAKGEYWEMIHQGFISGGEAISNLGVRIRVFFYDQYDVASFRKSCEQLLESAPSGVVLPPLFKTEVLRFADNLKSRSIPYVYVDTKLEDDSYFAYYGMPMYKSGYLCAALLSDRCSEDKMASILIVRILRDKARQSDPTSARREGFMDYIAEHYPKCQVLNVFIDPSDPDAIYRSLDDFFSEHPEVVNVAMFNSRVHLISRYLADHPSDTRRVIGFDNLQRNLQALKDGNVQVLIAQHPEQQSYNAVTVLSDYILMRRQPSSRDCYMHMDILTQYNIDNY